MPLYPLRDPLSSRIVQFSLLLNLINLFGDIRRIWAPFDSPGFTHQNLTCFKVVSVIFQQYHYLEIEGGLHHFRTAYALV